MAVTVRYECEVCWARAASPEAIEHQPVIHPAEPAVTRLTFPIIETPSSGMFTSGV